MKRIVWMLLVICSLIVPVDGSYAKVQKNKPVLNKQTVVMEAGESCTVKVKNTGKNVRWSVGNKKLISVKRLSQRKVRITAKRQGRTYIKAKTGKKVLNCRVKIKKRRKNPNPKETFADKMQNGPDRNPDAGAADGSTGGVPDGTTGGSTGEAGEGTPGESAGGTAGGVSGGSTGETGGTSGGSTGGTSGAGGTSGGTSDGDVLLPDDVISNIRILRITGLPSYEKKQGMSFLLNYEVIPAGADVDVEWESSNPLIASVNGNGRVECSGTGSVTITCRSRDGICGNSVTFVVYA